jgi:uncharacterized protein with PIN domain
MVKVICDKCKKEISGIDITKIEIIEQGIGSNSRTLDLCPECKKKLENFINE